ncbi:MAG: sulfotransferase domain-containing protein, partial [Desulfobacterales bacterium]
SSVDSCVVANGIPKSGTYLIHKIIEWLARWKNLNIHISATHWDDVKDAKNQKINICPSALSVKKLRNGQFVAAHLPFNKRLEKVMKIVNSNRRIKHVFIYRDPRDTFVSYMNFVTYSDKYFDERGGKRDQQFLQTNFSNDDDRLAYVIDRRKKSRYFLPYAPWLNSSFCHPVKFEDLFVEINKAASGTLGPILSNLIKYLEIDPDSIDPVNLYHSVYNKGRTASKEKNKIGQYKNYFKEKHYALIDNSEFKEILQIFGYQH